MEEHIRKKEKEKIVHLMDLSERAEETKREIADLRASREKAEHALAALTDMHKRTEGENLVRELDHLQVQRKLESLIDIHEMELAKQKDLVEALNQELDDQDHELSLERSRYVTHTRILREVYEQERQQMQMPKGIRICRRC
jgi:hypothetical protein